MLCEAALLVMTLNLYHEARSETERGMQAVADTVLTRGSKEDYPDCVTDVVFQRKQFSWANRERIHDVGDLITLEHKILNRVEVGTKDFKSYQKADRVARKVLANNYKPVYRFTHYHSIRVKPYWSVGKKGYRIGNHVFYRLKGN